MQNGKLQYVFGPVYSWRLGMSLGIDPISSRKKTCNFSCIYCQLGKTSELARERQEFISVDAIIEEIRSLPPMDIDHYTFAGRGEPTLAKNLGAMIDAVRGVTNGKIAVITNAALIDNPEVQDDLSRADFVLAKLDACDEGLLESINFPSENIHFQNIVDGMIGFRKKYAGKFALQIMFVDQNKGSAQGLSELARKINPDEIQINTPLRPCGVKPLSEEDLLEVKKFFKGLSATTVYENERREIKPLDASQTALRHGKIKK